MQSDGIRLRLRDAGRNHRQRIIMRTLPGGRKIAFVAGFRADEELTVCRSDVASTVVKIYRIVDWLRLKPMPDGGAVGFRCDVDVR